MNALSTRKSMSEFYARVGQDRELASRYLKAVEGKHSGEAIKAIAAFAATLGFSLTVEEIASEHLK